MDESKLDDRRKGHCRQGKIMAFDPQGHQAQNKTNGRDQNSNQWDGKPEGYAVTRPQNGGTITAECDKGGLPKGNLPGNAGDDDEPQNDERCHRDQGKLIQVVIGKYLWAHKESCDTQENI